jgi:adenosylmethionine-8-amino-7-oxononanoate aminotransferase
LTVRRRRAADRDGPAIDDPGQVVTMTLMNRHGPAAPRLTCRSARTDHLLMHFTRNGAFGPDGKPLLVLERGEGAYVFDTDGKRYFDGLSSLFCCQIGYSFGEEMASVAAQQLSTLAFNTNWATAHPPAIKLAAALAERAPGDLNRVFFTNGGSESVEAAWKIVRQHYLAKGEPQRTKAIAREIAYHGVTLGRAELHRRAADEGAVRRRADPGRADLQHQPLRDPDGEDDAALCARLLDEAERPIVEAGPETVAMLIAEPVQNAGGCLSRRTATGRGCARCATSTGSRSSPTR